MRPEADEGLADGDIELYRHHPGRLVDRRMKVRFRLELDRELAGQGISLAGQDSPSCHIGHDQRVCMLVVA